MLCGSRQCAFVAEFVDVAGGVFCKACVPIRGCTVLRDYCLMKYAERVTIPAAMRVDWPNEARMHPLRMSGVVCH